MNDVRKQLVRKCLRSIIYPALEFFWLITCAEILTKLSHCTFAEACFIVLALDFYEFRSSERRARRDAR